MSPKKLSIDEKRRIYITQSYIINHLDKDLKIEMLARMTALSKDKFEEGFAELFGMNTGKHIHEARMQLALFLLRNTDKPIKEISSLTGYAYTKNFMISFKKYFRKTAGSIRAQEGKE